MGDLTNEKLFFVAFAQVSRPFSTTYNFINMLLKYWMTMNYYVKICSPELVQKETTWKHKEVYERKLPFYWRNKVIRTYKVLFSKLF